MLALTNSWRYRRASPCRSPVEFFFSVRPMRVMFGRCITITIIIININIININIIKNKVDLYLSYLSNVNLSYLSIILSLSTSLFVYIYVIPMYICTFYIWSDFLSITGSCLETTPLWPQLFQDSCRIPVGPPAQRPRRPILNTRSFWMKSRRP